ncbi:hypothetical protein [Bradyrhizobium icense]|uniref:hypothetical protein n=1 Tax=Bradyrhizobium icense TaxID=1274631 RepID=UPI0012E9FC45|nr:hypothetical protein [Bradyrhizobium icense]
MQRAGRQARQQTAIQHLPARSIGMIGDSATARLRQRLLAEGFSQSAGPEFSQMRVKGDPLRLIRSRRSRRLF